MSRVDELISKAHNLWREGKENQMPPLLYEAIQICKEQDNIPKQIELLNEYGGCLRVIGEYQKAIYAIEEALKLIDRNYCMNTVAYATTLMNLGNVYRAKKDYSKAQDYMLKSKSIFETIGDKSYSYVGLLNNLSLVYQESKELESAEKLQLEAISLLQNDPKYKVPLAISCNNLYQIQRQLGKISEGLSNVIKAKEILEKEVGTNHPLYASVINNLADIHFHNKDYENALKYYENAMNITKECYGVHSEAYTSVSKNYQYVKNLIEKNNF